MSVLGTILDLVWKNKKRKTKERKEMKRRKRKGRGKGEQRRNLLATIYFWKQQLLTQFFFSIFSFFFF